MGIPELENWSRPHLHALLRNDLSQWPPPTSGPSSCRPLSRVLRFQIQPPLCLSLKCQSPGATSSRGSGSGSVSFSSGFCSFHFLFLATTPGAGGGAEGGRPLRTPPQGRGTEILWPPLPCTRPSGLQQVLSCLYRVCAREGVGLEREGSPGQGGPA